MAFPDVAALRTLSDKVELGEFTELVLFFSDTAAIEDAVWPADDAPLAFASVRYLDRFKSRLIDTGKFDDDEISVIMRHARAHAGGMASADARRARVEDDLEGVAASEAFFQLPAAVDLEPVLAAEAIPWMQVTPAAGAAFTHPRYGKLQFTREDADAMVTNFRSKVYQEHIPVDAEHQTKLSGALGYFKDLRVRKDGAVEARIELTDRGASLRQEGGFRYFSPEFFKSWTDPASGKKFSNLLVGGAFTTRPFFKDKHLAPLAASEITVWTVKGSEMSKWKKDVDGNLELDAEGNPQLTDEAKAEAETEANAASEAAIKKFRDDNKLTDEAIAKVGEGEGEDEDEGEAEGVAEAAKAFSEQFPEQHRMFEELQGQNAVLRRQEQHRKFTDVVLGRSGEDDGSAPWGGETVGHVTHLIALSEKFGDDSDEIKHYVALNKEHAEQLKTSSLFGESGSSSVSTPTSGEDRAIKLARAKQSENEEMSFSEAMNQVLEEHPEIYAETLD